MSAARRARRVSSGEFVILGDEMDVVDSRPVQIADRSGLFGDPNGIYNEDATSALIRPFLDKTRECGCDPSAICLAVQGIARALQPVAARS